MKLNPQTITEFKLMCLAHRKMTVKSSELLAIVIALENLKTDNDRLRAQLAQRKNENG